MGWNSHPREMWMGICLWPIEHKHTTYKVTVAEGNAVCDQHGNVISTADGEIRKWGVYNSINWNALEKDPVEKRKYPNYEPVADNEYVVEVETRYRLFHKVESTLRICTQMPKSE